MDNNKRQYDNCNDIVEQFYKDNHILQTYSFVKKQINKYCNNIGRFKLNIWDAIKESDRIIDISDPDLDLPQIVHALQTAEKLRKLYPNIEWLPLVGLIHDIGKIICLPEYGNQPQHATVGDIYPVGCKFSDKIVFHNYFKLNDDNDNPLYNTKYGIYKQGCGLDNLIMSFGHDEYLYQVLKHNKCLIPEIGLRIIRYNSFYSWHSHGAYTYFMDESDYELRKYCKIFSKCDLYSKDNNTVPNIDKLKDYYQGLINKYFPNQLLEW
jgi:inositol oxygenase